MTSSDIANPRCKLYPTDLSDVEWDMIQPLLPRSEGFVHLVEVDFREILNGIFYMLRSSGQWEMMP